MPSQATMTATLEAGGTSGDEDVWAAAPKLFTPGDAVQKYLEGEADATEILLGFHQFNGHVQLYTYETSGDAEAVLAHVSVDLADHVLDSQRMEVEAVANTSGKASSYLDWSVESTPTDTTIEAAVTAYLNGAAGSVHKIRTIVNVIYDAWLSDLTTNNYHGAVIISQPQEKLYFYRGTSAGAAAFFTSLGTAKAAANDPIVSGSIAYSGTGLSEWGE